MSPKCTYCGEPYDNPEKDFEFLLGWLEVHCPWWAPAHRKCSDACETVACEELARMYERQTPEGLEDETPGLPPRGHGYARLARQGED